MTLRGGNWSFLSQDPVVDPTRLPEFARRFRGLLNAHGTDGAFYGHASVGCLHIRPVLNLKSPDDLARMRRKHIGIVFQFFNLLEGMTVLENVALPAVIAGRKRKMAETRARDLLDLLGIGDKAAAVPGVLSGGQRQRLAIARALANEPTLLLADEPTGALDSEGGSEVIELMRRLHRGGQTIILVTHDPDVAAAAERVVRMRDGRIVDPEPAIGEDAVIGAR